MPEFPVDANVIFKEKNTNRMTFSVYIQYLYSNNEQAASATVYSQAGISWEGRLLSQGYRQQIRHAIEDIQVNTLPQNLSAPTISNSELLLRTPSGMVTYRWWSQLPDEWRSLAALIELLKSLSLVKI
ncbi:MAG: hypothetical protein OEZ58_05355 [Gammaproteobacteria bacterium]|nr:hypothetical protein [Gammaproteobacteria bacterium]MDH5728392.1 hypothetical protein [Gammaproteobacteria bacterium]